MDDPRITEIAADTSDPRAGLRAVTSLRLLADTLELRQVEAALRAGLSWQTIADALGVTRQAVHKKYAKRVDPRIPLARRTR
jgi:DNA-binding XRE family transcriptional regulator